MKRSLALLALALLAITVTGCQGGGSSTPQEVANLSASPDPVALTGYINETASQSVTLVNNGSAEATGISVAAPTVAGMTRTTTCSGNLAPGASCTITLNYTPTSSVASNSLTLNTSYSSNGSSKVAALTVNYSAQSPLSISANLPEFGISTTGTKDIVFTITNQGEQTLSGLGFVSLPVSLTQVTSTCSGNLPPSSSCTVTLAYTAGATPGTSQVNVTYGNGTISNTQTLTAKAMSGLYSLPIGSLTSESQRLKDLQATDLPDAVIMAIATDAAGVNIYAAGADAHNALALYISHDGGISFTKALFSDIGITGGFDPNAIKFSGSTIYIGTGGGLFKSSNDGAHFTATSVTASSNDIYLSSNLVAVATNNGLWYSTDNGAHFNDNTSTANMDLLGIAIDSTGKFYVDTTDNDAFSLVIYTAATINGAFEILDTNGAPISSFGNPASSGLYIDQSHNNDIYAAGAMAVPLCTLTDGALPYSCTDLMLDPTLGNVYAFACSGTSGRIFCPADFGLYMSTDHGANFSILTTNDQIFQQSGVSNQLIATFGQSVLAAFYVQAGPITYGIMEQDFAA